MSKYEINLNAKHISEFTQEDTIYLTDNSNPDHPVMFLCQFVLYDAGKKRITGRIIRSMVNEKLHSRVEGTEITVAEKYAALYGAPSGDKSEHNYHHLKPSGYFLSSKRLISERAEVVNVHPSYGVASLTRFSGGGSYFGATVRPHGGIALQIKRARLSRSDYHSDNIYDTTEIIRVVMTETQFGQLISNFNRGSGTPVTITRLNGESIESPPFYSKLNQINEEFDRSLQNAVVNIEDKVDELTKFVDEAKMSKTNKEFITKELNAVRRYYKSKLPFMAQKFSEQLEESVGEAKTEINAFIKQSVEEYKDKLIADHLNSKLLPDGNPIKLIND